MNDFTASAISGADPPPVLSGRGIAQIFGDRVVLDGADVDVRSGEVVAIMGASGSGKSTLLYALAGLRRPDCGVVRWAGADDVWELAEPDLTKWRRQHCGFVFQFPAFLQDLSLVENVGLPLVLQGSRMVPATDQARVLLDRLGLAHVASEFPHTLSGGELQRASIARALVGEPAVVFADEPTGALDEDNTENVIAALAATAVWAGVGVLVVTHDPLVAQAADRVLQLRFGVLEDGTVRA